MDPLLLSDINNLRNMSTNVFRSSSESSLGPSLLTLRSLSSVISSNLVLKLVLMRAIRENKRLTTAFPMGRRILDYRPVPDGEVGHIRFFVCFPLVLSIKIG